MQMMVKASWSFDSMRVLLPSQKSMNMLLERTQRGNYPEARAGIIW
jgi:hypothetical protein